MIDLPDATAYPCIEVDKFEWLYRAGVPSETLVALMPIRFATGRRAVDGIFEPHPTGSDFLVFDGHPDDIVYWSPRSGALATAVNRAFALGEENIHYAPTYALGASLAIHATPLEWLRDRCRGIVVLDWSQAFDRLRDAPRIAITSALMDTYKKHMRPVRMPVVSVLPTDRKREVA